MGYKIKEHREAAGFTQEELAEKAGLSRTTIAMLESNGGNTTTKTLAKIATALGISLDALFFEDFVQPAERTV